MEYSKLVDTIDDRLEKRFESYAQSQIKLHTEYHQKLLSAVDEKLDSTIDKSIGKYVNGKIDKIQKQMDSQDVVLVEVKSLVEKQKFIIQLWGFLKVLGGVAVSIGGAILMYKQLI